MLIMMVFASMRVGEVLALRWRKLVGKDRFGYGGLGLAYAFEHAVSDNNLPLLWWPGADWTPLFDR